MARTTKDNPNNLTQEYRRVFALLLGVGAVMVFLLPAPANLIVLIGLGIGLVALLATDRTLVRDLRQSRVISLPAIHISPRLGHALEIGAILIVLWGATWTLQNWSPDMRIKGPEFSYLVNSGAIAAKIYDLSGSIPLWNPFIAQGEPMLESPFGFVLNPIMTLPIFWFGVITGTKVAVLLHIGIMAIGGWLCAYVLKLRAPARILAALMMGSAGGMAGAIGYGFYQMSLSQAYMPWIYAGVFGTIYTKQRRWMAILAVATTLQIFAGTFWYVLPTAIGCAIIVLFHLVRRDKNGWFIDFGMIVRLAWAGVLMIGLSAIRFIPQFVNYDMIAHPRATLDGMIDFFTVATPYFVPEVPKPFDNIAMHFQYIMPPLFALFLIVGRVWAALRRNTPPRYSSYTARVVIPGLILIFIFTGWAQEGTPVLRWITERIPTLGEWRFLGRMLAASLPWFVIIAAIWFDDIWVSFSQPLMVASMRRAGKKTSRRLMIPLRVGSIVAVVMLVATVGAGAAAASDLTKNWERMAGVEPIYTLEEPFVEYLRETHPGRFVQTWTGSFFIYLPFYENLVRAAFGNPDYRPDPITPTISTVEVMQFPPEYAIGFEGHLVGWAINSGFRPVAETVDLFNGEFIYYKDDAPTFMFAVHYNDLANRTQPLTRYEALPVDSYEHNIDWIRVTLGDYTPGFVLVAQEVAFPGWEVEVNGQPASLESVGGLIGVRLPDKAAGAPMTEVIFRYEPRLLHISGWITVVSVVFFSGYALYLDRLILRRKRTDLPVPEPVIVEESIPDVEPEPEEPIREPVALPAAMQPIELASEIEAQSAEPVTESEVLVEHTPPSRLSGKWIMYGILSLICLILMAILPPPYPTLALFLFVLVSLWLGLRDVVGRVEEPHPPTPSPHGEGENDVVGQVEEPHPPAPSSLRREGENETVVDTPPLHVERGTGGEVALETSPEPDSGRLYLNRLSVIPVFGWAKRGVLAIWRSSRLFGLIGVGAMLMSAELWHDPRWGDAMPEAVFWLAIGMISILRAIWLSKIAPPTLVPTTAPMSKASRFWFVPFLIGVAMLALLSELNGEGLRALWTSMNLEGSPPDIYGYATRDAQFALLAIGSALMMYGLGGAPPIRLRFNPRKWDWILIGITVLAFALRVWDLDWRIRVLIDELHVNDAIRSLSWNPNTLILTGMTGLSPYTWVYAYWNLGLVSLLGPSFFSLRFLAVICGMIAVPATYYLARTLFDRKTGLLAAFLLTCLAPHIHWSRLALFQIADPLGGVIGFAFFVRALKYNRRLDWAMGGAFVGFTNYFYEAGRLLFVPLSFAWVVGMVVLMPNRLRWLKAQWRGLLIYFLAMLLTTAPVYYTIFARGSAVTGRMDDSGLGSGYFRELFDDGVNVNDLLELGNRAAMPVILYVAPPPWSEDPAMNPGFISAIFLIGFTFLLWRVRSPSMIILGWMLTTSLGNALLRDSTSQFRYTVVWNAVAITLAVGVRYIIPILLPVGERWIERAREKLFARRTLQVRQAIPYALAGVVGFVMAWYYFVPYLAFYNAELRGTKGYRDGIDVALRAVDLPPNTEIYIIGKPEHDQTVPSNFLAFMTNNARGLHTHDVHEMGANQLMRLPRDKNYAFFVEPDDSNYINLIRLYFPNVELPVYSDYPYIPPDEQYILLFAPQSEYVPPPKK